MPVLQTDKDYYIMIVFSSAEKSVLQFAKNLKAWLKMNAGASFSIAIGSEQQLENLSASYRLAITRLKQRLIMGQDVIIANDVSIQDMKVQYPVEIEKKLENAIRFGDQAQAQCYLNSLFDRIASTGKFSLDNWSQLCFDLLEMGYRIAKEFNIVQLVSVLEKVNEISVLSTDTDIRIWISNYLNEIMTKIKEFNSRPSLEVKKALSYIEEHFAENLTLASLASHIGLSPNYLSQMFKRNTGKTILQHLTYYRLQEAKKLLKQGNYNVSEISFRVGYDNQRYFSQVFTKQEGVTPSGYRKSVL
jgi:two-component system response regulator YesN